MIGRTIPSPPPHLDVTSTEELYITVSSHYISMQNSVSFLALNSDGWPKYIVARSPTKPKTLVFEIERQFGTLLFSDTIGVDVFDSNEEAIRVITKGKEIKTRKDASGLIGYVFSDGCTHLFLAKNVQERFLLFEEHWVYDLESVEILNITISGSIDPSLRSGRTLTQFPFHVHHFFCPTFDMRQIFGENIETSKSIWNQNLIAPFDCVSEDGVCIKLFQGSVCFREFAEYRCYGLLVVHRLMPLKQIFPIQGRTFSAVTNFHDYDIDLMIMKKQDNTYDIHHHKLKTGNLPFFWKIIGDKKIDVVKDGDRLLSLYLQQQKERYGVEDFLIVSHMIRSTYDMNLIDELENIVKEFDYLRDKVHIIDGKNFENFTNSSLTVFSDSLFVPTLKAFGFSNRMVKNANKVINAARQTGILRHVISNHFEGNIVSIFYYLLKASECLINQTLGKNVIAMDSIETIRTSYGCVSEFVASFVVDLGKMLSVFGNLRSNIWEFASQIQQAMPSRLQISPVANVGAVRACIDSMIDYKPMTTHCVSRSQLAFIVNKKVDNMLLQGAQARCSLPLNEPVIIFLSDLCYLNEILFENMTATHVSIRGGMWLNRMFTICENLWLPSAKQHRFSLEQLRRMNYSQELRTYDYEPVRFLELTFCSVFGSATATGIYVYGNDTPYPKPAVLRSETKLCFEYQGEIAYKGSYCPDNAFAWEVQRITMNGSLDEFYRQIIGFDDRLDYVDIDYLLDGHEPEGIPRKADCDNCKKRQICQCCWMCNKLFCRDCLKLNHKRHILCDRCVVKLRQRAEALTELDTVRWDAMNTLYPFIEPHRKLMTSIRSLGLLKHTPVTDTTIPIIWTMYELPNGTDGTLIESLISDKGCFETDANFLAMSFILSVESDIDALEIDTNARLRVDIDHGTPQTLVFEAPGGKLPCSVSGRVVELRMTGEAISINKIKFHGKPLNHTHEQMDVPPLDETGIMYHSVSTKNSRFSKRENRHELEFEREIDLVGIHFPDISMIQRCVVLEVNSLVYHCAIPTIRERGAGLFLPSVIKASRMRIWYRNLASRYNQSMSSLSPVPLEIGE